MGMFSKLYNDKDASFNNEDRDLEELYQKLFKKIARDFVFKEDVVSKFEDLFDTIEQTNPDLAEDLRSRYAYSQNENATLRAIEYKDNLNKPKNKRKKYLDITNE